MSANIRRIIFNTRERVASTDYNDLQTLQHRALIEAAVLLASGGSARRHGVVSGLETSVTGVGLNVTVSAGLALMVAASPSADDSETQWIELVEAETVTLDAADGANPRWDVIEIAAGDAVELSSLRDVYNPALGTFTPQTLEKRRASAPTVSARAGTPAAVPEFPVGTAGSVPLAYVYVPASAASLAVGAEVLCRPMLTRRDDLRDDEAVRVRGGGISADGTTATVELHEAQGHFADGTPFEIDDGTAFTPNTIGATATYPAAGGDRVYHAYAVQPRYPAADTTLAAREFVPGSAALTAIGGGVAAGVRGCFVIVAETGVGTIPDADTAAGAPAGSLTLSSNLSGLPGAFIPAEDAVYLGSFQHDQSSSRVFQQESRGAEVRGPFSAAINFNASGTETIWTDSSDTLTVLPVTARMVEVHLSATPNGNATASVQPDWGGVTLLKTGSSAFGIYGWMRVENGTGNLNVGESGNWTSDPRVTAVAYKDSCIARRGGVL